MVLFQIMLLFSFLLFSSCLLSAVERIELRK